MRWWALLLAISLLGCSSEPAAEPTPEPSVEPAPTTEPEPTAEATPTPQATPSPVASAPRPTPTPKKTTKPAFVEPKPRPFANGRPSWRQEPWWELQQNGRLLKVVYKVGELYGVESGPRPGMGRLTPPPHPPTEWRDHRCKRCSVDANPAGNPIDKGPIAFSDLDEEMSEADQAKAEADFRAASETWPKGVKLDVASDGWVTLTHTKKAHRSVQAWIRHKLCPHRGKKR